MINTLGKAYALTLCNNNKYIYYHNPKVATRSIIGFLSSCSVVNHSTKNENEQLKYDITWDNYFQFSFVRNPYDRLLSCFIDKTKKVALTKYSVKCYDQYKDTNFKDFVMQLNKYPWHHHDIHLAPQADLLNLKNIHFIGRFENLAKDFLHVVKALGMEEHYDSIGLSKKNPTWHKHYREYYDAEMIDKVRSIYSADFERFGYEF